MSSAPEGYYYMKYYCRRKVMFENSNLKDMKV